MQILQVFPLDSCREGLRERGWVIICWHFEKKATTYYVGRLYLLSFMFPRYRLMEWGVPSLHHLKARLAFFCFGWIISLCLLFLYLSSCGRSFFYVVGWLLYCCLAVLDLGSPVLVPLNGSAALSSECACPFV